MSSAGMEKAACKVPQQSQAQLHEDNPQENDDEGRVLDENVKGIGLPANVVPSSDKDVKRISQQPLEPRQDTESNIKRRAEESKRKMYTKVATQGLFTQSIIRHDNSNSSEPMRKASKKKQQIKPKACCTDCSLKPDNSFFTYEVDRDFINISLFSDARNSTQKPPEDLSKKGLWEVKQKNKEIKHEIEQVKGEKESLVKHLQEVNEGIEKMNKSKETVHFAETYYK